MLAENVRVNGMVAGVVFPVGSGTVSSDGAPINPDAFAQTIAYNVDQSVNYYQFTDDTGATYRQTLGYTGGLVTSISAWVKQ